MAGGFLFRSVADENDVFIFIFAGQDGYAALVLEKRLISGVFIGSVAFFWCAVQVKF